MGGGAGLRLPPPPRNIHFVSYMEDRAQKEELKRGAIELFFLIVGGPRFGKVCPPPHIFQEITRLEYIHINWVSQGQIN